MEDKRKSSKYDSVCIQTYACCTYHNCEIIHSPVTKKWEVRKQHKFYGSFDQFKLAKDFIDRKGL